MKDSKLFERIFSALVVIGCIVLMFFVWLAIQTFMYFINFWGR